VHEVTLISVFGVLIRIFRLLIRVLQQQVSRYTGLLESILMRHPVT